MYVDVSHFMIRMGTLLVLSVAALRQVATNTTLQHDGRHSRLDQTVVAELVSTNIRFRKGRFTLSV